MIASSTGFVIATSGANDASVGTVAWVNTVRVTSEDSSSATAALSVSTSQYLVGFTPHTIPAAAAVVRVVARIKLRRAGASDCNDSSVRLFVSSAPTGADLAVGTAWPTSLTNADYDFGGLSLTPAQLASTFGVGVSATSAGSSTAGVDAIWTNAYYIEPSALAVVFGRTVIVDWVTGHSGSVTAYLDQRVSGKLRRWWSAPGEAPTDNWDATYSEAYGTTVSFLDRDTSRIEVQYPGRQVVGTSSVSHIIRDLRSVTVSNAGNGKTGRLILEME